MPSRPAPRARTARRTAIISSATLHAVVLLLLLVGLPNFERRPPPEPLVLTVDILPTSELSNVKPSEAPPAPKEKPKEETPKEKKETPHVTKTPAPTPPPPPQQNPAPPKEEPKKQEVKKEEEKPQKKPKDEDLLAVLKSVREEAAKDENKKPDKQKEQAAPTRTHSEVPYDPNMPLSLSVKDTIRQQLYKCWSVDAGAKDAYKMIVVIDLWLNRDGSLIDEQYTDGTKRKMAVDPDYRAAAERAFRAVKLCAPLTGLPAEKYEGWSYMEFTFDPSQMLY